MFPRSLRRLFQDLGQLQSTHFDAHEQEEYTSPPLTSVRTKLSTIAARAVDLLVVFVDIARVEQRVARGYEQNLFEQEGEEKERTRDVQHLRHSL